MLLAADGRELPQLARLSEHRPLAGEEVGEMDLHDRQREVGHLGDDLGLREALDAQGVEGAEEGIGVQ